MIPNTEIELEKRSYCYYKEYLIATQTFLYKGSYLFISKLSETDHAKFNKNRLLGGRQHCQD